MHQLEVEEQEKELMLVRVFDDRNLTNGSITLFMDYIRCFPNAVTLPKNKRLFRSQELLEHRNLDQTGLKTVIDFVQ